MGFWLFMFVMTLLCPVVMLAFGWRFKRGGAPAKINYIFGYRTPRSMKNRESWEFAHRCCGQFWWWAGWPMLSLSMAVMSGALGDTADQVGRAATMVVSIQLISLVLVIPWTERALKRKYDQK